MPGGSLRKHRAEREGGRACGARVRVSGFGLGSGSDPTPTPNRAAPATATRTEESEGLLPMAIAEARPPPLTRT